MRLFAKITDLLVDRLAPKGTVQACAGCCIPRYGCGACGAAGKHCCRVYQDCSQSCEWLGC